MYMPKYMCISLVIGVAQMCLNVSFDNKKNLGRPQHTDLTYMADTRSYRPIKAIFNANQRMLFAFFQTYPKGLRIWR